MFKTSFLNTLFLYVCMNSILAASVSVSTFLHGCECECDSVQKVSAATDAALCFLQSVSVFLQLCHSVVKEGIVYQVWKFNVLN